ncbi:MAG: Gx transporter family protein [Thermodesulfobacteriota bacterium]|nr:Gx transporter family protein [Thermodesulfobacteriota bacterium]
MNAYNNTISSNTRLTTLAILVSMAVVLHWVEGFIPSPAPFLRLGLANILTICAIYLFGGIWGIAVVAARVIIGSLLSGSIFTPAFFLSMAGGLCAGGVMWAMPKRLFSITGVSVAGAAAHMTAQVVLASIIIQQAALTRLMPAFILVSMITGIINGYAAKQVIRVIKT